MNGIESALRANLRDAEYSEGYAESFLNAYIATQIKVIREQRGMTQAALAEKIGTTQAGVSRVEDVNYSSWNIRTLTKIARAFAVRLRVSFEPYGTLPNEAVNFDRKSLQRVSRDEDPGLLSAESNEASAITITAPRDSPIGQVLPIDKSKYYRSYAGISDGLTQDEVGGLNALCN